MIWQFPVRITIFKSLASPGQENLCILYSTVPIDFYTLMDNLSKYPGDLTQNLDALLNGSIIDPKEVDWNSNSIDFKTIPNKGSVIFIQILINHI